VCLENTSHDLICIMRVELSSFLCFVYIHCVYDCLECEYLLFYLHNKSSVIEHQFTSGGLFDFVYCAYNLLLGHASTVAGGTRSMGVVEQGAECKFIHLRERYLFVLQVGLVLEIETDSKKDWNFVFSVFIFGPSVSR